MSEKIELWRWYLNKTCVQILSEIKWLLYIFWNKTPKGLVVISLAEFENESSILPIHLLKYLCASPSYLDCPSQLIFDLPLQVPWPPIYNEKDRSVTLFLHILTYMQKWYAYHLCVYVCMYIFVSGNSCISMRMIFYYIWTMSAELVKPETSQNIQNYYSHIAKSRTREGSRTTLSPWYNKEEIYTT